MDPRTYNKNLPILRDFFKWAVLRGKLHGDPTLPIQRARKAGVYRTTFTPDQRRGIVAAQEDVLFSRNRFNVAISRAQCLAYVVASPRLLDADCRSPEQMRLVNSVCQFAEIAERG